MATGALRVFFKFVFELLKTQNVEDLNHGVFRFDKT